MSKQYPFLVARNLSVWRTREAAIRGTVDLGGARDVESCVIDERTGEIVYEPRASKSSQKLKEKG